ncbi:hypothetical protein AABM17_832 [Neisseria musculi]|uniref:Uncharacterized protein n=1 Tax=Neisseria musculi TaxID=1815583 RepID=A0A7H1M9J8_9NEIS|nr:hypothetical protein H7A79_0832 [Neisseria musculi]
MLTTWGLVPLQKRHAYITLTLQYPVKKELDALLVRKTKNQLKT